jgi:predicted phosphodiesterase
MIKIVYLLVATFISLAHGKSEFIVAPYIVVGEKGGLSLHFRPGSLREMDVTVESLNPSVRTGTTKGKWTADKLHKIDLGFLKCGEGLRYKFSSSDEVLDNSLYAIPCEGREFHFGFMSDTQIKNSAGQARADSLSRVISDLQKKFPISLIINAGDIVQYGGIESEWLNFFRITNHYLQKTYLMAAVGNHEYYESPSYDKAPPEFLIYMRNGKDTDLGFIQLDLDRMNLLMLNSNFESMSESKIFEQWLWLEEKLEVAESQKKPTIVIMHHSPFSSNLEHFRTIPSRLRTDLVPILEKYSVVKMMISGHLHMYERSQKKGITYLVAGPSGGINNVISYKNPFSVFIRQFTTTFSVFRMDEDKIEVLTYEGNKGMVIDSFVVPLN